MPLIWKDCLHLRIYNDAQDGVNKGNLGASLHASFHYDLCISHFSLLCNSPPRTQSEPTSLQGKGHPHACLILTANETSKIISPLRYAGNVMANLHLLVISNYEAISERRHLCLI